MVRERKRNLEFDRYKRYVHKLVVRISFHTVSCPYPQAVRPGARRQQMFGASPAPSPRPVLATYVACVLDKLPKRPRFQFWENEHASDARSQKLKTGTHRTNTLVFILKEAKITNTSVIVRCTLVFEQLKGRPKV